MNKKNFHIDEADHALINELYERYNHAMMKRARYLALDAYIAEDIVSSCWVRLMPKARKLMEMRESCRRSYVLTSVTNEYIDLFRKLRRQKNYFVEMEEDTADPRAAEALEMTFVQDNIDQMIATLPQHEANVVSFKLDGVSNTEISEYMQITRSAVRVYWLRGREKMRSLMQSA